jgi:hypothetical protein
MIRRVPQGLDVLFPFILFGDFRSLLLVIFFLGFGGGCMHEPFVVIFPLISIPNP